MMAKDQIDDIPGMDNIEEKDLDQYGVWVNTEGSDSELSGDDSDLLDIEEDFSSETLGDDLGDLNDLLLSIDEENDQDDTIYLEEDVMSLDLDEETDEMVMENTESSNDPFDMDDTIEIPSLDGEEISISLDDDDLQIPTLDENETINRGFDGLDSEFDSLSLDESIVDGLPAPAEDDEIPSFGADSLEEESLDDLDLGSIDDDGDDYGDISFDEDLTLPGDDSIELDLPEPTLADIEDSNDLALEGSSDDLLEENDPIQSFHEDNPEDSFTAEEIASQSMPGAAEEKKYVTESGLRQSNESLPELELDDDLALSEDLSYGIAAADSSTENESFDDITAVTNDFFDEDTSRGDTNDLIVEPDGQEIQTMTATKETPSADQGGAASVLLSIEKELHAIRSELTDLRTELKKIRTKDPVLTTEPPVFEDEGSDFADVTEEEPASIVSEEEPSGKIKGFFEDDEDETIALTGDELDNILNSAEFTEEAGEPSLVEEDDFSAIAQPSVEPVSTPFEDLGQPDLAPIEEISLEEMGAPSSDVSIEEEHDDEDNFFKGSESEIETMANLDIEKELAGIEDLSDGESDMELYTHDELDNIEIELPLDDSNAHHDSIEPTAVPEVVLEEEPISPTPSAPSAVNQDELTSDMPYNIKQEIKAVLQYMDQLLDALPQEKIADFARSEHFETYKKLFEELGI